MCHQHLEQRVLTAGTSLVWDTKPKGAWNKPLVLVEVHKWVYSCYIRLSITYQQVICRCPDLGMSSLYNCFTRGIPREAVGNNEEYLHANEVAHVVDGLTSALVCRLKALAEPV